ncbi:MAG: thymidylate synthase [Ghiorsea sp.]
MRFTLVLLGFFTFLLPQVATCEIASATDKVVEKFMELDFDASETVSLEEYELMVMERLGERFTQMDANSDYEISEPEYRKFWTQQKAQYYRPRR